jgi:hypothetical protein
MMDCHQLDECQSSKECIVCGLEIRDLELQVFNTEIFSSPKGYGKSNLAAGGCYRAKDYSMKCSLTRT